MYDDFAPAMQVAHIAPATIGSKAQPFMMVALNPGRDPFETPAYVSGDMAFDMREVFHAPKNIHFQGTLGYKTANLTDVNKLVDACFSMNDEDWSTGEYHSLPDTSMIDGGIDSVNLVVATFMNPMGAVTKVKGNDRAARKEIIHRQVNRGEAQMKVMKKEPEQQLDVHHMQGARVLMALKPGPQKTATFRFYDGAHRKLPNSFVPSNLAHPYQNLVQAKLDLMKKYERFWMNNGREYNMKIAIFIARNRLTFYANGGAIGQAPDGEEEVKKFFHRYVLVRSMLVHEDCIAVKEVVKQKELPDLSKQMTT